MYIAFKFQFNKNDLEMVDTPEIIENLPQDAQAECIVGDKTSVFQFYVDCKDFDEKTIKEALEKFNKELNNDMRVAAGVTSPASPENHPAIRLMREKLPHGSFLNNLKETCTSYATRRNLLFAAAAAVGVTAAGVAAYKFTRSSE